MKKGGKCMSIIYSDMIWKVDTPSMLKEMVECGNTMGIWRIPVTILQMKLAQVADRAIELNDPELLKLMLDLKLIETDDKDV